jgi:hypothetical protein
MTDENPSQQLKANSKRPKAMKRMEKKLQLLLQLQVEIAPVSVSE